MWSSLAIAILSTLFSCYIFQGIYWYLIGLNILDYIDTFTLLRHGIYYLPIIVESTLICLIFLACSFIFFDVVVFSWIILAHSSKKIRWNTLVFSALLSFVMAAGFVNYHTNETAISFISLLGIFSILLWVSISCIVYFSLKPHFKKKRKLKKTPFFLCIFIWGISIFFALYGLLEVFGPDIEKWVQKNFPIELWHIWTFVITSLVNYFFIFLLILKGDNLQEFFNELMNLSQFEENSITNNQTKKEDTETQNPENKTKEIRSNLIAGMWCVSVISTSILFGFSHALDVTETENLLSRSNIVTLQHIGQVYHLADFPIYDLSFYISKDNVKHICNFYATQCKKTMPPKKFRISNDSKVKNISFLFASEDTPEDILKVITIDNAGESKKFAMQQELPELASIFKSQKLILSAISYNTHNFKPKEGKAIKAISISFQSFFCSIKNYFESKNENCFTVTSSSTAGEIKNYCTKIL